MGRGAPMLGGRVLVAHGGRVQGRAWDAAGEDKKKKRQGEEKEATQGQMTRFSSFLEGQLDDVGLSWPARGRGRRGASQSARLRATLRTLGCDARCSVQVHTSGYD